MLLFWWRSWQCCSQLIWWACSRNLNLTENLVWVQHYAFCYPQETPCKLHTLQHRCVCSKNYFYTVFNGFFWAFLLVLCVSVRFLWTSASLLLVCFLACHPSALWSGARNQDSTNSRLLQSAVLHDAFYWASLCHVSSWNHFFPSLIHLAACCSEEPCQCVLGCAACDHCFDH